MFKKSNPFEVIFLDPINNWIESKTLPNVTQLDLMHINHSPGSFISHCDQILPFKVKTLHIGGSDISKLQIEPFYKLQKLVKHHTLHSLILMNWTLDKAQIFNLLEQNSGVKCVSLVWCEINDPDTLINMDVTRFEQLQELYLESSDSYFMLSECQIMAYFVQNCRFYAQYCRE